MTSGLRLEAVSKRYGAAAALAGVELLLPPGSYAALMGPNGSGKSTLLRLAAGVAVPSAGRVRLDGVELRRAGAPVRRRIGFLGHEPALYPELTVRENLSFHARLFDLPHPETAVAEVAELLDVRSVLERPAGALSRGTRQRAALARVLLHRPAVLLLDEPFTGLDADSSGRLARLLRGYATAERIVVVASHDPAVRTWGANQLLLLEAGRLRRHQRLPEPVPPVQPGPRAVPAGEPAVTR